jgi:hypothetical protein
VIIKVLLIASVIGVAVYLLRGSSSGRHLAFRRLVALALAVCWIAAVLSPGLVTWLANRVGVGRGTDLLVYGLAVGFVLVSAAQHQRIQALEYRIATLTRTVAVQTAVEPTGRHATASSDE